MKQPDKLIVNFCPTGMIPTKEMTPHVPISVSEIVEDVHRAVEIGITMVHIHARDENTGVPTWITSVYEENGLIIKVKKVVINIKIPINLLGINFKIPYNHKKYHSGIICLGVSKVLALELLTKLENK